MKKLSLGVAALLTLAASFSAVAADIAAPVYTKAPAAVIAQNWGGFYIGGNLGGVTEHASGTSDFLNNFLSNPALVPAVLLANPQSNSFSNTHFIGGIQAGYNWQFDPRWVLGVEADWDWAHTGYNFCRQTDSFSLACTDIGRGFESISSTTDWIATARARLGVTVANVLLYGTGGAAWGHIETTLSQSCLAFGCGISNTKLAATSTASTVKTGWVAGLGAEAALGANWSVRAEWLHIDLGTIGNSLTTAGNLVGLPTAETTTWSRTARYDQFRIGLNYRFAGWQ
jgi:outer membrane immunogenic protein